MNGALTRWSGPGLSRRTDRHRGLAGSLLSGRAANSAALGSAGAELSRLLARREIRKSCIPEARLADASSLARPRGMKEASSALALPRPASASSRNRSADPPKTEADTPSHPATADDFEDAHGTGGGAELAETLPPQPPGRPHPRRPLCPWPPGGPWAAYSNDQR